MARFWRGGRTTSREALRREQEHRAEALRDEMATALEGMRSELVAQMDALRRDVHAFAGSLHADSVARVEALRATVETDLAALLRFRQAPDSDLESLLTDSMKTIVERATAQIQNVLLDRSELNVRVLEQELVRVGSQLRSRLDELEARCAPAGTAELSGASRPAGASEPAG